MSDQRRHSDTGRDDLQENDMTSEYLDSPTGARGRPPIRWAGVVWGVIVMGVATATLYVASAPERVRAVHDWLWNLDGGVAWALILAVVGGIIVVFALLGAIRSMQRRHERDGSGMMGG